MAAIAPERLITAAEFAELDFGNDTGELVRGEVLVMPKPKAVHGWVAMQIALQVGFYLREHRRGELFAAETGFLIERDPDTLRAPDVAFVCAERLASGLPQSWFTAGPDLAVEVMSPSDRWHEVIDKAEQWLASGSKLVWLIDPDGRQAYVLRERSHLQIIHEHESLEGMDVLPELSLPLRSVLPTKDK